MRGRKPKPTVLKLITGNPGKRPLNKQEPKVEPVTGEIKPPEHLKGAAVEEWNIQIAYLTKNGVIGANELSILADYCYLYGKFVQYAAVGETMNAALIGQMRGLRAELGIGPSVRSKIKTGKQEETSNPFEALK